MLSFMTPSLTLSLVASKLRVSPNLAKQAMTSCNLPVASGVSDRLIILVIETVGWHYDSL